MIRPVFPWNETQAEAQVPSSLPLVPVSFPVWPGTEIPEFRVWPHLPRWQPPILSVSSSVAPSDQCAFGGELGDGSG